MKSNTHKPKSAPAQEPKKIKKTAAVKVEAAASVKPSKPARKGIKKSSAGKEVNQPKKASVRKVVKFDKKITDKLKKIVANYTEYPELLDSIERNTTKNFIDELNIDSVDFVEIIVDVEQAFNITIKDEEIYQLKSFEDLYVAIEEKINETKK